MPFGTNQTNAGYNPITRIFGWIFGIPEFHSHFRWRAVKKYINWDARKTLEIGAGSGLMTFEVAKRLQNGTITSTEFDVSQVEIGQRIIERTKIANVSFSQLDVQELHKKNVNEKFDQVLAIDVLEHIEDDIQVLKDMNKLLNENALLIISVPTPNYQKYFGREMHLSLGHKRDGYWIDDIQQLLESVGFKIERYHYYARQCVGYSCTLWYTKGLNIYLQMCIFPFLKGFSLLFDWLSPKASAASLALRAIKVKDI